MGKPQDARATHRIGLIRWTWIALIITLGNTAFATSLQVSPTSITLTPARNADALWLSNTGAEPVHVQLRVFRWTQSGGIESLEATQEVIASPPMQTIAPGARQLVRLIRPDRSPVAGQASYRVLVDELPSGNARQGLQLVLRYSVPVFVQPSGAAPKPALAATLVTAADGASALEVRNTGTGHAQLADLVMARETGPDTVLLPGLVGYVLPGQAMRWTLPGAASRYAGAHFKARINGEAEKRPLPLAPPSR